MIRLLLLGDSLIAWGRWDKLLPEVAVQNRGIPGEWLAELALRLEGELVASPGYDALVLQSGTNDLLNGETSFPRIYATLLPRLRLLAEKRPIILCSLAPMPLMPLSPIRAVNRHLQTLAAGAAHCFFLDLFAAFGLATPPEGESLFLADQVHFSTRGYALWAEAIRDAVQKIASPTDRD